MHITQLYNNGLYMYKYISNPKGVYGNGANSSILDTWTINIHYWHFYCTKSTELAENNARL